MEPFAYFLSGAKPRLHRLADVPASALGVFLQTGTSTSGILFRFIRAMPAYLEVMV